MKTPVPGRKRDETASAQRSLTGETFIRTQSTPQFHQHTSQKPEKNDPLPNGIEICGRQPLEEVAEKPEESWRRNLLQPGDTEKFDRIERLPDS